MTSDEPTTSALRTSVRSPTRLLCLAVVLLAALHCGQPAGPAAQGVVLVTVDTLRADHVGAYGYPRDTTPNLDALAKRGVLFRDVTVQWPKTWASMASVMTGRFPSTTGLRLRPRVLPEPLTVLSEVFADSGFETAAIVANYNVGRSMGFQQGFDHFVESWSEGWRDEAGDRVFVNAAGRVKAYTNARIVTDQALAWLEERDRSRPFFLWAHYMDPHGPYLPPDEYGALFDDTSAPHRVPLDRIPEYQHQNENGRVIDDLVHYTAQYDRLIRYFDDEFGRLLAGLDALGHDRTLLAVTADHGESLDEHGYYLEHGFNAYQPTARVPLVIAHRKTIQGGLRIEAPIALIDLGPTLVQLAGIEPPASFEGRSHAAAVRGERAHVEARPIFMEAGYDIAASQRVIRDGPWKLVHIQSEEERSALTGSEYELYDLRNDPGEGVNVARWNPDVVTRLREQLEAFHARDTRDEPGREVDLEALPAQDRKMLEALGYLEAEPEAGEATVEDTH
ncbi:MAG: sulfatase [Myxococcota bacterium]|nr:sulfatase [Myxococcota bacterium]